MASNMYIEFDPPLEGGSTATGHEKDTEILSWNHGFSQPTSATRSAAGAGTVEQANHMNLSFTKYLDAATASILKANWSGSQFNKATLYCYRSDGATDNKPVLYLQVDMEHVLIANYSVSGGPGDLPVENISLDYGIVTYTYTSQTKDKGTAGGNLPVKHDLETRVIE